MSDLAYFILSSYGMTQILVYGKILDKIRPTQGWMGELLSCPMCTGFWVGLFLWALNNQTQLFNYDHNLLTGLLLGSLSSGTSYILNMIFGDCGFKIEHKILGGDNGVFNSSISSNDDQ